MNPRLVLAGGTGFLGRALAAHFAAQGCEVVILTRHPQPAQGLIREVAWDGVTLGDWRHELDGARALINLAGLSVNCRYHARNRRRLLASRLDSTRVLGQALAACASPPPAWLNSSTATIYRHTFGPAWDEAGEISGCPEAKDIFSVHIATEWERALQEAPTPRTRKVALRSAMVLGHAANSVLPTLLRLARLGLGGRLADGRQYVSWIHVDDFCRAIDWILAHPDMEGPVNVAAPHPLPNAEFMAEIRRAAGRSWGLPATRWMLELGAFFLRTETELVLKSRRVVPGKLLAGGFQFRFPTLPEALAHLVG
jgi:uncharacterized protein (TIGR01777 family)